MVGVEVYAWRDKAIKFLLDCPLPDCKPYPYTGPSKKLDHGVTFHDDLECFSSLPSYLIPHSIEQLVVYCHTKSQNAHKGYPEWQ